MQRVLKFPSLTRRLNASSQLKGIFSTPLSCGSCPFFLPAASVPGAGTALHCLHGCREPWGMLSSRSNRG